MSKMNLVVDLKGYDGTNSNTCQAKFKKNAQYIGIDISEETVQEIKIPGGGAFVVLFEDLVDTRKFIYLETSRECAVQINDIDEVNVKPIVVGDSTKNGVYFRSSDMYKAVIGNDNAEELTIFYITSK